MSTASESESSTPPMSTSPIGGVPFDSNPFDPTPLTSQPNTNRQCLEVTRCPRPEAQTQGIYDVVHAPCLFDPVPSTYTANYAAFSTAFLSPFEIGEHWDDTPVVLNNFNSETTPEGQFLDAVGRVSVYDHFKQRIVTATVIDFGSTFDNPRQYRFFATYSHIMDNKNAYIRLVAYDRAGFRCDSSHPDFGNFILVIPRELNDVAFPAQLRFHALHATEICHDPDVAHHRIRHAANSAFTKLERVWWDCGRCAVCDSDL